MSRNWEQAYAKGDTPWDKGRAAPPIEEFLARRTVTGEVLVPGCGSGHDVRLLAGRGADVIGLDLAPGALEKARRFPPVGTERYALGDFLALDEAFVGRFDWVVEHTCLCAIDPAARPAYARSVRRALKPEGNYLAVFFREVPDFDGEGPPWPISGAEIEGRFGADFELVERFVPRRTYPSRPVGCEELCWMRLRA